MHRQSESSRKGFTVLEILVVVGIISFILAIIGPHIMSSARISRTHSTRKLIEIVAISTELYRHDFRTLPPDTSVDPGSIWRYLVKPVTDSKGATHNYNLKIPADNLLEYNDPIYGKSFKVVDAWMQPITFVGDPKNIRHNRDSCDIFSAGPDKKFDTADDITNWKE